MLNPLPIPPWVGAERGAAHFGAARWPRRDLTIVAARRARLTYG